MLLFAKEPAADQRRAGFSVSKENCGQPMFTFPPPSREQRSINSFGPTWVPNKSWSVGPCHHQGVPWVLGHPETSPPPAQPVGGRRLSARPPAGVTGTGSGGVGGERGRPSPRAREPLPEEALSFPGAHCVAQAHLGSPQRRHSTQMPEEEGGLARHGGEFSPCSQVRSPGQLLCRGEGRRLPPCWGPVTCSRSCQVTYTPRSLEHE